MKIMVHLPDGRIVECITDQTSFEEGATITIDFGMEERSFIILEVYKEDGITHLIVEEA